MSIGKHVAKALELSDGTLPKVAQQKRAICHPGRKNFKDGLCEICFRQTHVTQAVERVMPAATKRQKEQYGNEIMELHRTVEYLEGIAKTARGILEDNMPGYAAMHFEGAKIAAADGDTRPAEWALSQVKVGKETAVQPPAKTPADSGVKIFIGVRMGEGGQPDISVADQHSIIEVDTSK